MEEELFAKAIAITSATEREAYLKKACAGNDEMLRRVTALVGSHENAGDFLEPTPDARVLGRFQPQIEEPGAMIGPYQLLQRLGEGGFGIVYLAEQKSHVQRRVALKIIKPGMDTAEVIARFESERQALALMDHPNIARVLDAGTTEAGHPYFVMELIKGQPITDYCNQNKTPLQERLRLFALVCQAVQHAHQKGVVHRDIKPSNILVTVHQQQATPKVIDFGVAKAITQSLTDKTLFTRHGQLIGSLHYMSPEQAVMSSVDIDTRSDIYSLGVVLYELLTGEPTIARDRFRGLTFEESQHIIRQEDPPAPSTRISNSGDTLSEAAASQGVEPRKLVKLLRGELDWIVMKALEKDRTRRYETADGLAADVLRYLQGEPVEAGPPSTMYRLRKLSAKYRKLLMTVAAIGTLLLAAATLSTWLAVRAFQAQQAEQAERNRVVENYARVIGASPDRFSYSNDLATFVFIAAFTSGDWQRAEAELRLASEHLVPSRQRWWQTHWWTVGPYPADLSAAYPPEKHLDPFQPVPAHQPDAPPLYWIPNTSNAAGGVGIANVFIGEGVNLDTRKNNSAFVQTRVFSAERCKATFVFRARDQARLWLNGRELAVSTDQEENQSVDVTLQAGWNTVLAHVVNLAEGDKNLHNLYFRVTDPASQQAEAP